MCHDYGHHLLKYLFGIYLCSMLISQSNVSNLLQNGQFPIFSLFWRPFLLPWQHKLISYLYTWAIVLIKYEEFGEKRTNFIFGRIEGGGGGGVNFLVRCFKFAPKWSISYIQPILAALFITIATVKVKLISFLFTWAIVLIIRRIW